MRTWGGRRVFQADGMTNAWFLKRDYVTFPPPLPPPPPSSSFYFGYWLSIIFLAICLLSLSNMLGEKIQEGIIGREQ